MNAYTSKFSDDRQSLLGSLRSVLFGLAQDPTAADDIEPRLIANPRAVLMDDISAFILRHRLEINPDTLCAAFEYVSGTNPQLARRIDTRIARGRTVDAPWLEAQRAESGVVSELRMLDELIRHLEQNLSEFGDTAHAARAATRDYSCALAEHGRELQRQEGTANVSEMVQLLRSMLSRTQTIEQQLSKSEDSTRELRENLEKAQRLAEEDFLTGLPNRRAFEKLFREEVNGAREDGSLLCVAFCDVDHFKAVNDTHGHVVGDRVLKQVARMLARISGQTCHVARHGGEEFVILFRGKRPEEAAAVLEEAREDMSGRSMVNRDTGEPIGMVTFSAGVAQIDPENPREAMRLADEALYRAKNTGRNRVCIAA